MQELVTNQITIIGKLPLFTLAQDSILLLQSFLSLFHETISSLEESVSPRSDTNLRMSPPLISA